MIDNYIADVKGWLLKPYREEGTIVDWLLFIGLLTVATILWTRVIKRLID